jgi:hypothetical protein
MGKLDIDRPPVPVRCPSCGAVLATYRGSSLLLSPGFGSGMRYTVGRMELRCAADGCRTWSTIPSRDEAVVAAVASPIGASTPAGRAPVAGDNTKDTKE